MKEVSESAVQAIVQRAQQRFEVERRRLLVSTDRLFGALMVVQWIFAIAIAIMFSPTLGRVGREPSTPTSGRPSCSGAPSAACRCC